MSQAVLLPKLGLTMEEATVVKWVKKIGDRVEQGDILLEVETDKSTMEVEAPSSGYLLDQLYLEGDVIPVSELICHLGETNQIMDANQQTTNASQQVEIKKATTVNQKRILLSPAARRKARELGLTTESLQLLTGSGPRNRIVLKDLEAYAAKLSDQRFGQNNEQSGVVSFVSSVNSSNLQATTHSTNQTDEVIVLNRIRSVTAKKLTASFRDVPQFTITKKVDLSNIYKLTNTLKSIGINISLNDFFIQAAAKALEKNELVNSYFYESENELKIIKNKAVNIGLAVALEDGLIVPVVKDANHLSLAEVSKKRVELIKKAKANQLSRDEITGGTFTISNLGSYEVDEFTAIINSPEAAILAVGSMSRQPVVTQNDQIEIRPMLTMTATFDHRIIDGADAAMFMKDLAQLIESDEWKIV